MSGLFRVEDTLVNKMSYYHIMAFMAMLPYDMFYSHLVLISFGIHTIINLKKEALKRLLNWRVLLLQSVFWVSLISALYAANKQMAFDEVGRRAIVLLLPVLIILNGINLKKYREQLLLWFAFVCTANILYLYTDALVTIRHYRMPLGSLFSAPFANHNFSEPIGMHATFFSMQIALSFIFLLWYLLKETAAKNRRFYMVCLLILAAGLIQLSSKSVCIALFVLVNVAVPYYLLQGQKRKKYVLAASLISVSLCTGLLASGSFRERYLTQLTADLSSIKYQGFLDSRISRWKVVVGLISNKPVMGYGAGSEVPLLHQSFYSHKLYNSFLNNLNAHNQYLSFLLKSGIIGLAIYLLTLSGAFKIALKQKDLLFISFLVIVALVSLSEDFLEVDKGIIFYAFFFTFFFLSHTDKVLKNNNLNRK